MLRSFCRRQSIYDGFDRRAALGGYRGHEAGLFGRTRGRGTKVKDWPDVQFIVANKQSAPVAVIVVKSRLLDVMKSLETTPEENLRMAYETIACLQDNGLEVIVDLEHAMDAACGRRETASFATAMSASEHWIISRGRGAMCRPESEPAGGLRYHRWRQS